MEKVQGIGGVFFRAQDPAALSAWYEQHLGVTPVPSDADGVPWVAEGGVTVFAPFPADTEYFGNPSKQAMVNFRVADLDAMVAQLEGAGISVTRLPDMDGIGRFAHLADPEGNPLELWEPAG